MYYLTRRLRLYKDIRAHKRTKVKKEMDVVITVALKKTKAEAEENAEDLTPYSWRRSIVSYHTSSLRFKRRGYAANVLNLIIRL